MVIKETQYERKVPSSKQLKIDAPAHKVWEIITESTDWNGIVIKTKTDWKPGSDILFIFEWVGIEYQDKGKVLEFEEKMVFAHSYWSAFSGRLLLDQWVDKSLPC